MRYLPHTHDDIESMLKVIGLSSLEELFASIPQENQLKRLLSLPPSLTELELKQTLSEKARKVPTLSFLGAGATPHFVPELVSQLLLRSEWYTAYTPYQPEASQGTLQAIFEFQTIVAHLLGHDIANASMYDGATAFAEALLMSLRLKPSAHTVLVHKTIHPEYRAVANTYLHTVGARLIEIPYTQAGTADFAALHKLLSDFPEKNIAAIAYQTPNFIGCLENQQAIIDLAHQHNALAIAVNTEPCALALIHSPGALGADISVSEGIGFCGHLSLGAPGVGLFATQKSFLRQTPGRICGATLDKNGNRGFTLTLSTREQHIRREKATSNICTNHGLMALAFSITLSLYGQKGFKELAYYNLHRTRFLREKSKQAGLIIAFEGSHFNETVIRFSSQALLEDKVNCLAQQGIYAGVDLSTWYPELKGHLLISTTELHSEPAIDTLIKGLIA